MILSGPFRSLIKSLVYASVVILTTAAGGVCGASPGPVRSLEHFGATVADFDGDNQPDLAITLAEGHFGYTLELELSTTHQRCYLRSRTVPFVAPFSFRLTARDVDSDTAGFMMRKMRVPQRRGKWRLVPPEACD